MKEIALIEYKLLKIPSIILELPSLEILDLTGNKQFGSWARMLERSEIKQIEDLQLHHGTQYTY